MIDQLLTARGVIACHPKQLPHNPPESVLRVRIILLVGNGPLPREAAKHEYARVRSGDGWETVRRFH